VFILRLFTGLTSATFAGRFIISKNNYRFCFPQQHHFIFSIMLTRISTLVNLSLRWNLFCRVWDFFEVLSFVYFENMHSRHGCIKKVAHTRLGLPSVGFHSWSRFLTVSLQVMWVINPAVGCDYFPPGLQLPLQPLRGLLPILLLGEQRHNGCEQFA